MRLTLLLALAVAGCDTSASVIRDGAMPDVAVPLDLAPVPDLAFAPDLVGEDLAKPPTTADYAGCANAFVDFTKGQPPTITFPGNDLNNPQYAPKCIEVTTQQTVTWMGDFVAHPLTFASSNGVMIQPMFPAPMTQQVQFTTPGYYGFYCQYHGLDDGSGMAGNVHVLP